MNLRVSWNSNQERTLIMKKKSIKCRILITNGSKWYIKSRDSGNRFQLTVIKTKRKLLEFHHCVHFTNNSLQKSYEKYMKIMERKYCVFPFTVKISHVQNFFRISLKNTVSLRNIKIYNQTDLLSKAWLF